MEKRISARSGSALAVLAILLACGMALLPLGREAWAGQGMLDGKTFTVETGEKGEGPKGQDTLVFKDGYFHSTGCDKYGFGDGAYTATAEGDTIRFEAATASPKKGNMTWKGTIQGGKIEVTYTWKDARHWYKPSPKTKEYWAKGEMKM